MLEVLGILNYFDITYMNVTLRPMRRQTTDNGLTIRLRRLAPTFPPIRWNVHDATLTGSFTHKQCL